MTNHLKAITTKAKAIRKRHPSMKWTDCIKMASGKKVGAIKIIQKGETKKTPAKKVFMQKRAKKGTFKSMNRVGAVQNILNLKDSNIDRIKKINSYLNHSEGAIIKYEQQLGLLKGKEKKWIQHNINYIKKQRLSWKKEITLLKKNI